jgi:hypothetical protein
MIEFPISSCSKKKKLENSRVRVSVQSQKIYLRGPGAIDSRSSGQITTSIQVKTRSIGVLIRIEQDICPVVFVVAVVRCVSWLRSRNDVYRRKKKPKCYYTGRLTLEHIGKVVV